MFATVSTVNGQEVRGGHPPPLEFLVDLDCDTTIYEPYPLSREAIGEPDGDASDVVPPVLPTRATTHAASCAWRQRTLPIERTLSDGKPVKMSSKWLMRCRTKVVGRQHYNAIVSSRALFRRIHVEWDANDYGCEDVNAIQVLNEHGELLGYLAREVASSLSPVFDKWPQLYVEGFVPKTAAHMRFQMPVIFVVFVPDDFVALGAVHDLQRAADLLFNKYCERAFCTPDIRMAYGGAEPVYGLESSAWNALVECCGENQACDTHFMNFMISQTEKGLHGLPVQHVSSGSDDACRLIQSLQLLCKEGIALNSLGRILKKKRITVGQKGGSLKSFLESHDTFEIYHPLGNLKAPHVRIRQ